MTEQGIALEYFLKLRQYNGISKDTFLFICLKKEIDFLLDVAQQYSSVITILKLSNQEVLQEMINDDIHVQIYDKAAAFENQISLNKVFLQNEMIAYDPNKNICILLQIGPTVQNSDVAIQQMVKRWKRTLFVSGFYKWKEGKHFIILSDKAEKSKLSSSHIKRVAVLVRGGYGDMVLFLPILQSFIYKNKIKVDIITSIDRVYKFLTFFMRDCNIIYLDLPGEDTFYMFLSSSFFGVGYYHDIYSITPNVIPNIKVSLHIADIWKTVLNVSDEGFIAENSLDVSIIPNSVMKIIRQKQKDGFVCVGIQLYDENKKYKSWSKTHILKFIDLCKNEKIFLINLVPNTLGIPLNIYDVSFLDFIELFNLIKYMDIIIGIDGCCGHIAGVLKVPNITIWGYDLPHCVKTRPISFRTISMNYSIVSKDELASSITPELVFSRLMDCANKKIQMEETLITINDTLCGKNIEYV